MSETLPDMNDRKAVEAFLDEKPSCWSVVLTSRAALRVLPLYDLNKYNTNLNNIRFSPTRLIQSILWCNSLSCIASIDDYVSVKLKYEADKAANAADSASNLLGSNEYLSASASAYAASAVSNSAIFVHVNASSAHKGYFPSNQDYALAFKQDLETLVRSTLDKNDRAYELAETPLWMVITKEVDKFHKKFTTSLIKLNQHWDYWLDWYQDRLDGKPLDIEFEISVAKLSRDEEPKILNARIKQMLLEHKLSKKKWDYFISYRGKNEAEARFVTALLQNHQKSVLVQFQDFKNSDNVVQLMDEGLREGKRMVALLSQDYFGSNFCKAELAAGIHRHLEQPLPRRIALFKISDIEESMNGLYRSYLNATLNHSSAFEAAREILKALEINEEPILPALPWDTSHNFKTLNDQKGNPHNLGVKNGKLAALPELTPLLEDELDYFNSIFSKIKSFHKFIHINRGNFSFSVDLKSYADDLLEELNAGYNQNTAINLDEHIRKILSQIEHDRKNDSYFPDVNIEVQIQALQRAYNDLPKVYKKLVKIREERLKELSEIPDANTQEGLIGYNALHAKTFAYDDMLKNNIKSSTDFLLKSFERGDKSGEAVFYNALRVISLRNWNNNPEVMLREQGLDPKNYPELVAQLHALSRQSSPFLQKFWDWMIKTLY